MENTRELEKVQRLAEAKYREIQYRETVEGLGFRV